MSEKKLTEEELQQVREVKQEYNNLAASIGDIDLRIADLEEAKNNILSTRKEVFEKEKELAKKLQDKYGAGVINIETGEIKDSN